MEQLWHLFEQLEAPLKNDFIVYRSKHREQVEYAFQLLARRPEPTVEDVKQVVERFLQGGGEEGGGAAGAPATEQLWHLIQQLEAPLRIDFIAYMIKHRDEVESAFQDLARRPDLTVEDVKQVVERFLQGEAAGGSAGGLRPPAEDIAVIIKHAALACKRTCAYLFNLAPKVKGH